jgi:hypothetical protein
MIRKEMSEIDPGPVRNTPRGVSPRGLPSDAFAGRAAGPPPLAAKAPDHVESRVPEVPVATEAPPGEPRDWEFHAPEPSPEKLRKPLVDPDSTRRRVAGLHGPGHHARLPDTCRERFSENWARLASEPRSAHRRRARRKTGRSVMSRWFFAHGRFELGAAVGPLLLLALLIAAIVYGQKLLSGGPQSPPHAVEAETR